jgi:hypothetical protein
MNGISPALPRHSSLPRGYRVVGMDIARREAMPGVEVVVGCAATRVDAVIERWLQAELAALDAEAAR